MQLKNFKVVNCNSHKGRNEDDRYSFQEKTAFFFSVKHIHGEIFDNKMFNRKLKCTLF